MKNYELTALISSELSEEEAKTLQGKIISLIQEGGGILNGELTFFRKKLAYPIKKQLQAYLSIFNFQLVAEKLASVDKKLKDEKEILRFLIVIKVPIKEGRMKPRRVPKITPKPITLEKKVELKEIEEKLEQILKEQ